MKRPFWRRVEDAGREEYRLQDLPTKIMSVYIYRGACRNAEDVGKQYWAFSLILRSPAYWPGTQSGPIGWHGPCDSIKEGQQKIHDCLVGLDILSRQQAACILGKPAEPQLKLL